MLGGGLDRIVVFRRRKRGAQGCCGLFVDAINVGAMFVTFVKVRVIIISSAFEGVFWGLWGNLRKGGGI